MDKAGFVARFLAWLVDGIAVAALGSVLAAALGLLASQIGQLGQDPVAVLTRATAPLVTIFLPMVQFLYFGYLWSHGEQSIGMRLLGVKLVRRSGTTCDFVRAGLRGTVGYWVSGLIFGLGYLWAAVDANREAWHDKIFDTWVVRA